MIAASKLADIQQGLCASLHDPVDKEASANLADVLLVTGISGEAGLNLYRNNYRGALQQALAQIYPVCAAILGERPFHNMTRQYQQTHPSTDWNLDRYGSELPQLLEGLCRQQPSLAEVDYLPDLALLEWNWHAAYYAPASQALNLQQMSMAEGQIEDFILSTLDGLSVMRSNYPVYDIWRAHRDHGSTEAVAALEEAQCLLIWRDDYTVRIDVIETRIFKLLQACQPQTGLEDIMQGFDAQDLSMAIQQGWVLIDYRANDDED